MNNSTLDLVKNILDKTLDMPAGRVWAYNGTQDLPEDRNLFIVLSYRRRTPYSCQARYKETQNGLAEVLTQNYIEDILISLCSLNTEAREIAPKVSPALSKSAYSQYIQEKYKIHISSIQPVEDNSFMEATGRLNRFDITIRVYRAYEFENSIDFYDKFPNTSKFEPEWLTEK